MSNREHIPSKSGLSEKKEALNDHLAAMERGGKPMSALSNILAAVIGVLSLVFFIAVLQSTNLINNQILTMKDGLYPLSVDAGSIDTNLVRIRTIVESMSTTEVADNDQPAIANYEKSIEETISTLRGLAYDINTAYLRDPSDFNDFLNELDTLDARLYVFEAMCSNSDSTGIESFEERYEFIESKINPVINSLLERNYRVLTETNESVEEAYDSASMAISSLVIFTIVVFVALMFFLVVYFLLISIRRRFDNNLRTALEEAFAEADAANEAKSEFLSNISHDIRTPMNAITGLIQIADEHIDDPMKVRQCLTRISTSSRHLLSLINDVLDMNKIESGKVNLVRESFSLKGVISQVETIMYAQPTTAKLDCSVETVDLQYDRFIGDAMRLRQVLLNLTSNALKYTKEGGKVRFIISEPRTYGESSNPSKVLVRFVVEDTGIGMSEEFIENIFEPFEREKNDYTNFTEGTGLGMAITKRLVDVMGGTIDVESELGVGTKFTVDLILKVDPRLGVSIDDGGNADEPATSVDFASGEKVSGRVLVVEDNDINMDIAKTLISSRGAEVDCAVDGLEAVVKVSDSPEDHYDLIFMDWQMPRMDGLEATRQIRKFQHAHGRRPIPIVAMTANAFDSNRNEALEAGMDDFLTKPINMHALEDALAKYLSKDAGPEDTRDGSTPEDGPSQSESMASEKPIEGDGK